MTMTDRDNIENKDGMEEKLAQVGVRILGGARNELYVHMRFMDVALSSFQYVMDVRVEPAGTDGLGMYFNPQRLGALYRQNRIRVNRMYLHMVLHCVFRHLIRRNGREELYYNLACDIVTESLIDSMSYHCVRQPISWLKKETYRKLKEHMKVLTPEKVYHVIKEWQLPEGKLAKLVCEFYVDDHCYWPSDDDNNKKNEIENQWKDNSEQMETDMETFSKESSESSGDLLTQVKVENKERYDYRKFLRKFSVLKEEMAVDPDSFDYVFYSFGLSMYGNMPLIEPQEWKETMKVEEFAIVIDTSMSCSGELVQKFLEETYSVLSENDSFFHKVNIHIIQCDDAVKTDKKISSSDDLKEYMENLELKGEGGTDFRPAFEYVDQLIKDHCFEHLKGLLYFTDGYGVYPTRMPPYETAFVFMQEDYEDVDVPAWAMKLYISEEDFDENPEDEGETKWT